MRKLDSIDAWLDGLKNAHRRGWKHKGFYSGAPVWWFSKDLQAHFLCVKGKGACVLDAHGRLWPQVSRKFLVPAQGYPPEALWQKLRNLWWHKYLLKKKRKQAGFSPPEGRDSTANSSVQ